MCAFSLDFLVYTRVENNFCEILTSFLLVCIGHKGKFFNFWQYLPISGRFYPNFSSFLTIYREFLLISSVFASHNEPFLLNFLNILQFLRVLCQPFSVNFSFLSSFISLQKRAKLGCTYGSFLKQFVDIYQRIVGCIFIL